MQDSVDYGLVREVPIPAECSIRSLYPNPDLQDAFEVLLPDLADNDPEPLARHLHTHPPVWVGQLMSLRDTLVAPFGIRTSKQFQSDVMAAQADRISFFRVFDRSEREIVIGQDDVHLNFRSSVLVLPAENGAIHRRLVCVTVVKCHNLLGRAYIAAIAPFHRIVVKGGLHHAAGLGWPEKTNASDR